MQRRLLLFLLLTTLGLGACTTLLLRQNNRLNEQHRGLITRLETLRSHTDSVQAHCEVLALQRAEFQRLYKAECERLKALKVKIRRTEAIGIHASQTHLTIRTTTLPPVLTTTPSAVTPDTLRRFHWHDPWNDVAGEIRGDSVICRVHSIDTLHQVVHRIPHRFLFFRWGTKALRQEIRSSNPSTQIVYTDYVVIAR